MTERRTYTPKPYQDPITQHILDVPRCAVWAAMGAGKTPAVLTALDALILAGEDHPTLVIGPLRVARDVWVNEARKWQHLRQISVVPIIGTEAARCSLVRRDASIHTVNYENLDWLVHYWGERWPYRTVIADESTRLKSYRGSVQPKRGKDGGTFIRGGGSKRARALGRVAHTVVKRFIELTGTPSPNGLKDLWGQAWFLDAGLRLGRTFQSFQQRWFQRDFNGYGLLPLPFAMEQIKDRLRDVCMTVDLPPQKAPVINNVYVDLPVGARRHYKDMEDEMFTQIEDDDVEAFNAAARTQKCLQLANGAAYVGSPDDPGERKWVAVHNAKLDALESVVEESAGAAQIVVYEFKSDAARIRQRFPEAVMLADSAGMDRFLGGKAQIGLAHPKSLGHGVDGLQDVTNIMTFFGHNWDLELYDQIIGRIGPVRQAQSGHNRPVFINHIIARDTVDDLVMARRDSKRTVQDILLEAMKRRQQNV